MAGGLRAARLFAFLHTDFTRASEGHHTDGLRPCHGRCTGEQRASGGQTTGLRRASEGQIRDGTRPLHGRRSLEVRGGRALRSRLGRMSAASRRRLPRVRPSLLLRSRTHHGLCTDARRTGNGHQTGGGRAGIRLMPTSCDIPRWAATRRTCHGRETDTPRATHGLETGLSRTIPPTGGQRACLRAFNGRNTDLLRRHFARRVEDNAPYPWALVVVATIAARIVIPAAGRTMRAAIVALTSPPT